MNTATLTGMNYKSVLKKKMIKTTLIKFKNLLL